MELKEMVEAEYKARILTRYDDMGFVRLFSKDDFDSLQAEPYHFTSSHGHNMSGFFYSYPQNSYKRLVVFDHGLGIGHRAYMKEIEILCSEGYRVFAYDHTGCAESGGKNAGGYSQSLCDLDDCLKTLKSDTEVDTSHISVIGHSWGGYSALNISALHPDIKRIVAISGFISVRKMIEQNFDEYQDQYSEWIYNYEKKSNPEYAEYDAVKTLQNIKSKALLIYSEDDGIVKKKYHYDLLYKALKDNKNIKFLLTSGKGHNPNYTTDAVKYLTTLNSTLQSGIPETTEEKEKFTNSFDWDRMTMQDEAVWKQIKDFLK